MTENQFIEILSQESEKMGFEQFEDKIGFDTEICGWKDIPSNLNNNQKKILDPARFRIRTMENRTSLTRSASSRSQLSTVSSSNASRNVSPRCDGSQTSKKAEAVQKKKRKESMIVLVSEDIANLDTNKLNANCFKIHKPPRPRKPIKPVKVFKLPRVGQDDHE